MAARCLQAALDKGGTDNVSVLLVRVKNPETRLDAKSRKRRNILMIGLVAMLCLLAGWAACFYFKPATPAQSRSPKDSQPDTEVQSRTRANPGNNNA
jgi:hypothetical protein